MKNAQRWRLGMILLIIGVAAYVVIKLPINLGLDLQGGMQLILEARDSPKVKADNDAVLGVLAVIRSRVDGLGVSEAVINRKGAKQIVVELPGIKDPDRAITLIGQTALLEFIEAEWAPGDVSSLTPEKIEILAGKGARLDKVVEKDPSGKVISERPIILRETVLTGAALKSATPGTNQFGEPVVNIEFTSDGAKVFRDVTTRSVGKPLAILLDKRIISAPNISEPIAGGRAQISGRFTVAEMRDLVIQLKAGALPVPVVVVSNKIVGPTLGQDSIEKSKKAGLIGLIVVVLFMIALYRVPGILAIGALLLYMIVVLAIFKALSATLTLPGIAGFILTVGMAVDANIIIFERVKEEIRLGQPLKAAVANGFSRAFITILDANLTTLLAAIVLFWLGTGTIKGFAVTLSIGILVSMFSAIFVTRLFIDGALQLEVFRRKRFF